MSTTTLFRCCVGLLAATWIIPSALGQESEKPTTEKSQYELRVKYAETRLKLAEVELQYALDINRRTPRSLPRITVERLKSNVAVAEEQLDVVTAASIGGQERIRLRQAKEKIRLAELDLENGERLYKANMVNGLEVERLKLRRDLAKLSVVIMKNPENFTTLLHYLEGRVDQMEDEILSLDQRLSKLEPTRGMLPRAE